MPPNYQNYSLRELKEAFKTVDREKYPERYSEIKRLLDEKDAFKDVEVGKQVDKEDSRNEAAEEIVKENPILRLGLFIVLLLILGQIKNYYEWSFGVYCFAIFCLLIAHIAMWRLIRNYRRNKFMQSFGNN